MTTPPGRRLADILVKVWRKNGSPINVLVHVEVQSEYEVDFPKQIHIYNSLIELRYDAPGEGGGGATGAATSSCAP
ncbi:MAG: hypothetical protein EBE86_023525 [Hormoscilla sp. GUM202]|nr:hypothetical protein [Hormoscilla sp. GUM202]